MVARERPAVGCWAVFATPRPTVAPDLRVAAACAAMRHPIRMHVDQFIKPVFAPATAAARCIVDKMCVTGRNAACRVKSVVSAATAVSVACAARTAPVCLLSPTWAVTRLLVVVVVRRIAWRKSMPLVPIRMCPAVPAMFAVVDAVRRVHYPIHNRRAPILSGPLVKRTMIVVDRISIVTFMASTVRMDEI